MDNNYFWHSIPDQRIIENKLSQIKEHCQKCVEDLNLYSVDSSVYYSMQSRAALAQYIIDIIEDKKH